MWNNLRRNLVHQSTWPNLSLNRFCLLVPWPERMFDSFRLFRASEDNYAQISVSVFILWRVIIPVMVSHTLRCDQKILINSLMSHAFMEQGKSLLWSTCLPFFIPYFCPPWDVGNMAVTYTHKAKIWFEIDMKFEIGQVPTQLGAVKLTPWCHTSDDYTDKRKKITCNNFSLQWANQVQPKIIWCLASQRFGEDVSVDGSYVICDLQ